MNLSEEAKEDQQENVHDYVFQHSLLTHYQKSSQSKSGKIQYGGQREEQTTVRIPIKKKKITSL